MRGLGTRVGWGCSRLVIGKVEEVLRGRRDAALEAGAQHGWLRCMYHYLGPRGGACNDARVRTGTYQRLAQLRKVDALRRFPHGDHVEASLCRRLHLVRVRVRVIGLGSGSGSGLGLGFGFGLGLGLGVRVGVRG